MLGKSRAAWWQRGAVTAVAGVFLLLFPHVAAALSYYQPGPSGTIGISRPTIRQQFVLKAGEAIAAVDMWLDGRQVDAAWNESGLISFTPTAPLSAGRHTVKLSVEVAPGVPGFFYDPVVSEFNFTVSTGAAGDLPGAGPEELRALELVNGYRRAAGLAPLTYSPTLAAAALSHARYLIAHPDQREQNPHGEGSGTALFTGASPGERAGYFGYAAGPSEVINFTDRAEVAVEGWMDTLYHRIPLLHPGAQEMGYALAGSSSDQRVNVLEAGIRDETPGTVAWPYPGQSGVPTGWDGAESPDPFALYPGATKPAGYTITLTFGGNPTALSLRTGTVTGPDGQVPVLRYDPAIDKHLSDTVALIPREPLRPGSTYTVAMAGEANLGSGAAPFERRWSFTTAAEDRPLMGRQVSRTNADGTIQRITVDGSGFGPGLKLFLGGLPVDDLEVVQGSTLSFRPPAGYPGGAADLVAVTPAGWESVWPGFFAGDDSVRARDGAPAFAEMPLLVNGRAWPAPALVHRTGTVLLPGDLLEAFGGRRRDVPEIGRSYWTLRNRTLDYTLGRTAASLDGTPLTLAVPVRTSGGRTYVDSGLIARAVGMGVRIGENRVQFGLLDISGHWAGQQILRLVEAGIISGAGDGRFQPDEPLSRAAYLKMLVGARELAPEPGSAPGLNDTDRHWVAQQGYIGAALRAGIVVAREYPGGRFEPDRPITREEIAVMTARALGLEARAVARKLTVAGGTAVVSGKLFTDASDWGHAGHIAVVVEQGLVTGYGEPGGTFSYRPLRLATRAEAAVMVARLMDQQ